MAKKPDPDHFLRNQEGIAEAVQSLLSVCVFVSDIVNSVCLFRTLFSQ